MPWTQEDFHIWREALGRRMDLLEERMDMTTETTARIERNTADAVEILVNLKGFINVVKWAVPAILTLLAAVLSLHGVISWQALMTVLIG